MLFFSINCIRLNAEQFIVEATDTIYNFRIIKTSYDFSKINLYLPDFNSKYILIRKKKNLQNTLSSLFENYNANLTGKTVVKSQSTVFDKIFLKKYLILDTSYQIFNIKGISYYKFKLYSRKRKKRKNFIDNILEQYAVEYNLTNIR